MEDADRFVLGRVYSRAALHDHYGGQRYGGIATPREHPIVMVFTGSSGQTYGYADEPDTTGVFHYFGEGQVGHMQFSGGNAAIRDHSRREKELHLFEQAGSGKVRYLGEVFCSGFRWEEARDKNGDLRNAIVFQLVPLAELDADESSPMPALGESLDELAAAADADPTEEKAPKTGLRKIYRRSLALKNFVQARAAGVCEGCGQDAPFTSRDGSPYLEVHHTNRLSDSGPGDRRTVAALCPNCHRRVHHGADGSEYNNLLKRKLTQLG